MTKRSAAKIGDRKLNGDWTPKRAHAFCMTRVRQIEGLLDEIAYCYGGVFNPVDFSCGDMKEGLLELTATLNEALETEAQL